MPEDGVEGPLRRARGSRVSSGMSSGSRWKRYSVLANLWRSWYVGVLPAQCLALDDRVVPGSCTCDLFAFTLSIRPFSKQIVRDEL